MKCSRNKTQVTLLNQASAYQTICIFAQWFTWINASLTSLELSESDHQNVKIKMFLNNNLSIITLFIVIAQIKS